MLTRVKTYCGEIAQMIERPRMVLRPSEGPWFNSRSGIIFIPQFITLQLDPAVLNHWLMFALCGLKRKRCGGRSNVEAWISNLIEREFCSKYIFEINLMLLRYGILEKLVTYIG